MIIRCIPNTIKCLLSVSEADVTGLVCNLRKLKLTEGSHDWPKSSTVIAIRICQEHCSSECACVYYLFDFIYSLMCKDIGKKGVYCLDWQTQIPAVPKKMLLSNKPSSTTEYEKQGSCNSSSPSLATSLATPWKHTSGWDYEGVSRKALLFSSHF